MSNTVKLKSITVEESQVKYEYELDGEIKKAFNVIKGYEINFSEDVSSVPKSVLAVPFIANVLPIVWVYDATLIIQELDKDFYDHLNDIKKGYQDMYPKVKFGGEIIAEKIVHTRPSERVEPEEAIESALLFSGGVDATSSLVTMLKEGKKPALVTLWGADVSLNDENGWEEKSAHTEKVAQLFGLKSFMVKTNFREFINETLLDSKVEKQAGDQWWHGFQHGIGIIGHTAPLVYLYAFKELCIAASFTRGENMTCASDPTIDEHVNMAGCRVIHDGYDYSRQDKIANIHSFVRGANIKKLPIKVCWISLGAKNCGKCEKCIRTACGFLAEGGDLQAYDLGSYNAEYARNFILNRHYFRHTLQWARIQSRLEDNAGGLSSEILGQVGWVLDVNFDAINDQPMKKIRRHVSVVLRGVQKRAPRRAKDAFKKIIGRG